MAKLPRPVIRPATRDDLDKLFGKGKFNLTCNAVVGLVRGKVVGGGGIAHTGGKLWAFCDLKPSAYRYKISIVRAASQVIEDAKARGAKRIWAEADPDKPMAVRWIMSLGFKPTELPRIFLWTAK